jgi:short-subunit dehydrogenase involved in D-alanine esterification of teichoic acids
MDIAIVTGAETPLGLHLIERLLRQGFRVHGIGNNFSKVTLADEQFRAHAVDLSDLSAVAATLSDILEAERSLDLLIHAIDVTPGAAFENLPLGNLEAILKVGLLGPVMMTRLALPNLLRFRGQLINVIPANKAGHPASAVNALLEGGLREMNRAIFDQARDAGLRVTNLILRQNPEPDGLGVQSGEQTRIDLEDVARALEHLIDPNFVNVPAEQVLFPRCSAASEQALPEVALPLDPYREVILPPQAYCPPEQPKIPTQEKIEVERTIPYSDEEMEARIAAAIEDFESRPEPRQKKDRNPPRQQQDSESSGKSKRRRGRRRGGRGKSREQKAEETEVTKPTGKAGAKKDNSKPENKAVAKPSPEAPVEEKPKKTVKKAAKKAAKKQAPAKKAAKKKAAKKAAKKAVKKAAK